MIGKRDVFWSYLSYILRTGVNLLLLPFILRQLPTDEFAIWSVFLSAQGFAFLLDFGLQHNILRNVSYVFSGSTILVQEGLNIESSGKEIDYSLLKTLIDTVKKIYMVIAFLVAILLFTVGTQYIGRITEHIPNQDYVLSAWKIFAAALVFNFYFDYYAPLLLGSGKIAEANKRLVFSRLVFLILGIVSLFLGFGLIGLCCAYFFEGFVNRVSAYFYFYDKDIKSKLNVTTKKKFNLFLVLWHNSYKMGIVIIAGFLISKVNIFIAAKYLPLKLVASYGLAKQILTLISTVASIYFNAYVPFFNMCRVKNKLDNLIKYFGISLFIMCGVYFCSSICILLFGNSALKFVGSGTLLLPKMEMFLLLIISILETNQNNFIVIIMTKNTVPFVKSYVISGISVLFLSLISVDFLGLGLLGIILSQGFVQLAYNNWKWTSVVLSELQVSFIYLLKNGFKDFIYMLRKEFAIIIDKLMATRR